MYNIQKNEAILKPFSGKILPLKALMLWLFMASSWFVFIEPAPYEYLALLLFVLFIASGMRFHLAALPLFIFCFFYNFGGIFSLLPHLREEKAVQFVATSFYMGITAIFLSGILLDHTKSFLNIMRNAWIIAGVIASILGIMGYFDVFGTQPLFAPILRAAGTFKDPNVFSTYLVAPILFIVQRLIFGTQRFFILSLVALGVMILGVFLSFSRGAWGVLIGSTLLLFLFDFICTSSLKDRFRIILFAFIFVCLAVFGIMFLLSFPEVREMFLSRAVLLKEYDSGETGRFANQLRSLPLLLENPNGLGPLGFARYFGQNPHNVYIFAFAAYGWLGGVSYFLLILSTCYACWKSIFTKSPWQEHAIVISCALLLMIVQGLQIDTDHWRHFYLLLGMIWGIFAANVKNSKIIKKTQP